MTRMAAVFVPRLGFSVSAPFVTQAINKSIEELGFQAATPDQVNVVMKFVSGRDVFVSLPTGSGKSVCFASVSIVFDKLKQNRLKHSTPSSVTIVISPLNALMRDQVSKFSSRGLKTAFIGTEEVQEKALCGSLQLIYFSPEALLLLPFWRDMLKSPYYHNNIVCLAVDEAHLVEKW